MNIIEQNSRRKKTYIMSGGFCFTFPRTKISISKIVVPFGRRIGISQKIYTKLGKSQNRGTEFRFQSTVYRVVRVNIDLISYYKRF